MMKREISRFANFFKRKFNGEQYKNFVNSNRFLAFFSLFLSALLWFIYTGMNSERLETTISDIPVMVNLSDSALNDELRIFSGQNVTARINITGNRLVVPKITSSDIQVVAVQAQNITAPGNYTLELTPKKSGLVSDYEFTSEVQPRFINVTVDRYREMDFAIENQINFVANSGLFVGNTVFSPDTIKISGPEIEVSKIKRATVIKNFANSLKSTENFSAPVILYDKFDKVVSNDKLTLSVNEVNVTIPVLEQKEVKIVPNFANKPEKINLANITKISPKILEIVAPGESLSNLEEIVLPEINFEKVSFKNFKFTLPINLPSDCRSLRNIYSVDVEVLMDKFSEKQFWITNFSFVNVPDNRNTAVFNGGLNVKILGPANRIDSLKSSDISLVIDLQNRDEMLGKMEVPCKIFIENNKEFWCPEEYFVNISVNEKESDR